jgi:hypothetical protein
MNESDTNTQKLELSYVFSPHEIKTLAHFFRQNQKQLPDGLEDFASAVEKAVYNGMSIDEAELFYS